MRAGLSTIHQTLTAEAATILNQSIAEACRRNHGQTTPLHVAATLLSSPSGYLRQACIRSHPNSSHPLQCRALELCFSVALERLPTAQSVSPATEPPISNALMAALKRAQAHQRRGCPDQQHLPLLAVKVELDQLIISILDDPSVSRVMREASFSSPAVKTAIERSVNNSISLSAPQQHHVVGVNVNFGTRMFPNHSPIDPLTNRSVYMNPRLQPAPAGKMMGQRGDEVKKVLEIMLRSKKRNPVLVGESEPEAVARELLRKIERKEFGSEWILRNVQVISMEKGILSDNNQMPAKMEELGGMIEARIGSGGGVILDLGDLKWLVEQQLETGRTAVVEMAKLLKRFRRDGESEENKLWLIGTATCETYLRCQVYHSTMETDWDLQALPMASRSMFPATFQRLESVKLLSTVEPLDFLKGLPTPLPALGGRASNPSENAGCCPQCLENYEKEVAKLTTVHKSFSEATSETSLPRWLQNAKVNTTDASQEKVQGLLSRQKTTELQKKWRDVCLHLHPNFHQNSRAAPPTLSVTNLCNPNILKRQTFQPMLQAAKPIGKVLQLNTQAEAISSPSPPGSPVTDLVLGRKGVKYSAEKVTDDQAKDFFGCVSSEPRVKMLDKFSNALDADTYKKLLKGLMEKAWWQPEAASRVASAITCCRLGNGKRRGTATRGDVWLLFTGPDRVGKKKVASVIAEQICGANPIMICLGTTRDDEESDANIRGKTAIDRIAEVVRRNPFSVIMLQDIDEADMLVRGNIKRAVERGRIADSHGREVNLGNAIFILSGDWSRTSSEASRDDQFVDENKLASIAGGNWQLRLITREKTSKRHAYWLQDDHRPLKPRKESLCGLSLDLNLAAADEEEDRTDGSHNSSELTNDHEEFSPVNQHLSFTSVPQDLLNNVDESIIFAPVDSSFVRREIKKTISLKFRMNVDEKLSLEIEDDVLDKILGGLWHDQTSLQEWIEKVLGPSFDQLKLRLLSGGGWSSSLVVRLVVETQSRVRTRTGGDWLPSSIIA